MMMTTFDECRAGHHKACPRVYPDSGFGGAFCDCDCHRTGGLPKHGTPEYRKSVELEFWHAIKDKKVADDFGLYLEKFPDGQFVKDAKDRLAKLKGKS